MMAATEENRNWFDNVASVLEQNVVGVKIGIYGLGVIGCCYALRSVRPFSKFRTSTDIPRSFYESKMKLNGHVVGVRFNSDSTNLLVDHTPLFFGKFRQPGALPLEILGINLTSNAVSWLTTIVHEKDVNFIVLGSNKDSVSCIVQYKNEDVAKKLLSLGFASVAPFNRSFDKDQEYLNYYKELLKLESIAEKKKVGMWWDQKRYRSLTDFIFQHVKRFVPSTTKRVKLAT